MLRDFDEPSTLPVVQVVSAAPAVVERVTATPLSSSRGFLARPDTQWTWEDLRDYVVGQVEQRFGAFPRNFHKELGIFKSFMARYPDQAVAIARYAFEVKDGYWSGAPVSVTRFCRGSDRWFAEVIVARLDETK